MPMVVLFYLGNYWKWFKMGEGDSWMLSQKAFEWIEENICFNSTILEFGSGEGSKRLAMNYNLYSVEHNPEWIYSYKGTCLYAPILLDDKYQGEIGWYDLNSIKSKLPNDIDLMIIDGPNGNIGRSGILSHLDLFSWDYPILIDDLHREKEFELSQRLSEKLGLRCVHFHSEKNNTEGSKKSFGIFKRSGA